MPSSPEQPPCAGRLLLITLSNIGDAVMTTPVLELMHQQFPGTLIDIVADARSSRLFEHCPCRGDIFLKHKKAGWRGLLTLIGALRRRRYQLVVDLRTDGLAYLLRAQRRLTRRGARPRGPHAVDRLLGVVHPLLQHRQPPPMRIWIDEASRRYAAEQVAQLPGKRWLAIGPGANWPPKIWPVERYRELISRLLECFDAVILTGGPKDGAVTRALAGEQELPAINVAGETDLLKAAAVLERARLFIGNDSGLGHLAAAMGTPTLTLFGPGEPLRYHPWGPRSAWIVAPGGDLNNLTAAVVADAVRSHLAELQAGPAGA